MSRFSQGFEQSQRADPNRVRGVLWDVEADAHVALCPKVVDLVGRSLPDDLIERAGIFEIAVDQAKTIVAAVRILVDALKAIGVERAGPADHADDLVALLEEQLRQIRPVLASDASDQCTFHRTPFL